MFSFNSDDSNEIQAAGLGALGATAGGLAAAPAAALGNAYLENKIKNSPIVYSQSEMDKIKSLLKVPKDIKTKKTYTIGASFFDPVSRKVFSPKLSDVLPHEYGHASSLMAKNKTLGLGLSHFINLFGKQTAPFITGMYGAHTGFNRARGKDSDKDSKVLKWLNRASQLATIGNLAEEGQASVRALRAIKRVQGKAGMLRALKTLGPAYGTYLASAVGSQVVAPWVGKKLGEYFANK